MKATASVIIGIIICILLTSLIVDLVSPTYGFFAKVDSGYVGIVTYFGKIEDRVLEAGFHVTRFFEHVVPVNVRTQIQKTDLVAFSSDIQQVTMLISINYNITPDIANTLFKTVGEHYLDTLVLPRLNEDAKVVVSNYTAESLVANRETLSNEILALLQSDLENYGITISTVSIENIDFTDAFEAAVEAKQVATQEAQKAKTQQDQQTMETQQAAERRKLQADAEAYETKIKAEAEAEANKMVAESVTNELIDYIQAQRWDGKLPVSYMGDSDVLPILNVGEMSDEEFWEDEPKEEETP